MKPHTIIALCLALAACGGGAGSTGPQGKPGTPGQNGAQGAPGKSAYEIWLEAGNTGTEQDFLDSLVGKNDTNIESAPTHYKNIHEYLERQTKNNQMGTYTETSAPWHNHNEYKQYIHEWPVASNTNEQKIVYTYNEKELSLANYGIYLQTMQHDFETEPNYGYVYAYIHNRDGIGANVYTPEEGTVFTGGTLAYLSNSTNDPNPTLIKGDSKFTYTPNNPSNPTSLELTFDNWYNLTFTKSNDSGWNVSVGGNNNTGNPKHTVSTGTLATSSGTQNPTLSYAHVKKDDIEETVGVYSVHFSKNTNERTDDTYLKGAFGGTKQ